MRNIFFQSTKNHIVNLCLIILFAVGCNYQKPNDPQVEYVLKKSGNNRSQLEEVILHYRDKKEDSLKLKAALFLIANMEGMYHIDSSFTKPYDHIFIIYDSLVKSGTIKHVEDDGKDVRNWDARYLQIINAYKKIQDQYGPYNKNESKHITQDMLEIKAKFLINNIDESFAAWKSNTWSKNVDFKNFCEYILPYNMGYAPLYEWRKPLQKEYQWLYDSLPDKSNTTMAVMNVSEHLKDFFYNRIWERHTHMPQGINNLMKANSGNCGQRVAINLMTLRALGIASAQDFVLYWPNRNWNHSWNVYLNENGQFQDFEPFAYKSNFWKVNRMKNSKYEPDSNGQRNLDKSQEGKGVTISKVFRTTYSAQSSSLPLMSYGKMEYKDIPNEFNDSKILDVTEEYVQPCEVTVDLNKNAKANKTPYGYLCVFNNADWKPIFWANLKDNKGVYQKMGPNVLYLPMFYIDHKYFPAANPFILKNDCSVEPINADTSKKQKIQLNRTHPVLKNDTIEKGRTYELYYWSDEWISLGRKKASSTSIVFESVPSNALFRLELKDRETTRQKERIFTISQGKQVWW